MYGFIAFSGMIHTPRNFRTGKHIPPEQAMLYEKQPYGGETGETEKGCGADRQH